MGAEQILSWTVLIAVLAAIASGRFRIDIIAITGLLILGLAGIAPPNIVFSGFGHPALATIITVFFISQGLINSGLLQGLGQTLASRVQSTRGQVISLSSVSALLSTIMNNVGAVGLMLPTAVRMARRAGQSPGVFGMPLAMFSILGGTITLIGSAPNIIIASHMFSTTGQPFRMFDYAPHGLAMFTVAMTTWLICKTCGITPGSGTAGEKCGYKKENLEGQTTEQAESFEAESDLYEEKTFAPLSTRKKQLTLLVLILAIAAVSTGLLHPAYGFGGAALLMFFGGVLKLPDAYKCIDLKIVFFLGAMLGIGQVLEHTGSLDLLSSALAGFTEGLQPFWLIVMLLFVASALSNAINNAASAVFMAPLAVGIATGSTLETAAALMAVAAGSNLTLLLPTHQAALMVLSKAPFPFSSFMRFGLILTFLCGLAAAVVIALIWQ